MANDFWEDDAQDIPATPPNGASGFWESDAQDLPPPQVTTGESIIAAPTQAIQSIPIIGRSLKAYKLSALAAMDAMTGKDTFEDAYAKRAEAEDAFFKNNDEQHPMISGAAKMAGAFLTPVAPELKAVEEAAPFISRFGAEALNMAGRSLGTGAIVGADAALGGQDPVAAAKEAALYGAAGELGGKIIGKMIPSQEALSQFRNERVIKAGTGQNKKVWKEINGTKDIQQMADDLRTPSEITGNQPVVPFGSKAEEILPAAKQAADNTWNKIEGIYDHVDAANNGQSINPQDIANAILNKASSMSETGKAGPVQEAMLKQAQLFENMANNGRMLSLKEAQDIKNTYLFKFTDSNTHALGLDGNNQIRGIITDQMEQALGDAAPAWKDAMRQYGTFATVSKAADDRALANVSNRFFSPSDHAMGAAVGVADAVREGMEGASPILSGAKGLAAAVANKVGRERGSSAAGVTAEKIGELVSSGSEKLGAFLPMLQNAASRGPQALSVAHYMLTQQNPHYQRIWTSEDGK